jgi:hypothetical protein
MFNWFKKKPIDMKAIDFEIEMTKTYVPWQITQDNVHGNQNTQPIIEIINGKKKSTYVCGCEFEEGIKSYSWSGHWCDEHRHAHHFGTIQRPIEGNNAR